MFCTPRHQRKNRRGWTRSLWSAKRWRGTRTRAWVWCWRMLAAIKMVPPPPPCCHLMYKIMLSPYPCVLYFITFLIPVRRIRRQGAAENGGQGDGAFGLADYRPAAGPEVGLFGSLCSGLVIMLVYLSGCSNEIILYSENLLFCVSDSKVWINLVTFIVFRPMPPRLKTSLIGYNLFTFK